MVWSTDRVGFAIRFLMKMITKEITCFLHNNRDEVKCIYDVIANSKMLEKTGLNNLPKRLQRMKC